MELVLALLLKYRYLILFPLAAIEGPAVALVAGFLVYRGVLNFWIALFIMLWGDIIPDSWFYCLGFFGSRTRLAQKMLGKSKLFSDHFPIIERVWRDHPRKMMVFGKLAYGMGLPFLTSAGMVRIPYLRFMAYAIPVTIFQYGVIMGIGYYLGNSYAQAGAYIDYAYFGLAGIVVLLAIGYVAVAKFARRKLTQLEEEEAAKIVG